MEEQIYTISHKYKNNLHRITVNNKEIYLGYFDNEELAAKERDKATKEHFGEFGNLNFQEL